MFTTPTEMEGKPRDMKAKTQSSIGEPRKYYLKLTEPLNQGKTLESIY